MDRSTKVAKEQVSLSRFFGYLAVLLFALQVVTSGHISIAWSSQSLDSRYLVIIDSSNSVGVEGLTKIRLALSEPSRIDEVAKTVTLIQYPSVVGPRVLNFGNSAELSSYLGALKSEKGSTDLNQIISFGQLWSREYIANERKVIWITDGGSVAILGSSDEEISQKLETIASLQKWTIVDLSEQSKLSFLADGLGQYSHLSGNDSGTPLRFDIPGPPSEIADTNATSTLLSILRDRENNIFSLIIFLLTTTSIIFFFMAFLGRSRRSRQERHRETLLAAFAKRLDKVESQTSRLYWEKLPEILRRQVDYLGTRVNLTELGRFVVLLSSTLPVLLLVLMISGNFLLALFLGFITSPLILKFVIRRAEKKDIQKFSKEFPGFLSLLSSGLKSGLSLEQGIDAYCQQNKGVAAQEFRRVLSEIQLGSGLELALSDLVSRRKDEDLSWLVTAISIQKSVGGSLSTIIDTVLETIQSRGDVKREIKSLSAEGKLSAYVLIALPIFIFSFLFITRRGYVEILWKESLGLAILFLIGTLITIGWFWMQKVVNIKV